jgi:DNA repair protein RadC
MQIVREISGENPLICASDVYKFLEEFKNEDREHFVVIGLDTKNKPCYREIVAIGTLNQTTIHPREIFKKAITMSCNSIIVAHNHPSGNLEPSEEDIDVTQRLLKCSDVLDIQLLDHLIITSNGYDSIKDRVRSMFKYHREKQLNNGIGIDEN